uniref:Uncharacterized protein n=1 Tax=Eutreptiella gymnastica TaxID=73025 RepID=A0A7S4CTW4_9EUGL
MPTGDGPGHKALDQATATASLQLPDRDRRPLSVAGTAFASGGYVRFYRREYTRARRIPEASSGQTWAVRQATTWDHRVLCASFLSPAPRAPTHLSCPMYLDSTLTPCCSTIP